MKSHYPTRRTLLAWTVSVVFGSGCTDGTSMTDQQNLNRDAGAMAVGTAPVDLDAKSTIPRFMSGRRLVPRFIHAEGLPPVFAGAWDRERNANCTFKAAEPDVVRCLPSDPVPKDTFEQWERGQVLVAHKAGNRLSIRHVLSEDGGRFPSYVGNQEWQPDLYDAEAKWPCRNTVFGLCVPPSAMLSSLFFAEETCSAVRPIALAGTMGQLFLVFSEMDNGKAFRLGPPLPRVYLKNGPKCEPYPSEGARYFEVGEELPGSALAQTETQRRGAGRSTRDVIADPSSKDVIAASERVFDKDIEDSCYPVTTSQGLRCLPNLRYEPPSSYYSDAACTALALSTNVGIKLGRYVAFGTKVAGKAPERIYLLASKVLSQAYQKEGDRCGPVNLPLPQGALPFALEYIPFNSFIPMEERHEFPADPI